MLVLSRKEGQSIKISDDITVRFLKVGKNRVSIAIDAPKEVSIRRGELALDTCMRNDMRERSPSLDPPVPQVA